MARGSSSRPTTDVVLELVEPGPAGWARVRHRDGQQGFVKATQVWGF